MIIANKYIFGSFSCKLMSVDEAIAKIDSYIKEILKDIVTLRTKLVDVSTRILTKTRAILDNTILKYVRKQIYDDVIVIEKEGISAPQIIPPDLKLNYTGTYMDLETDGEVIQVPSVPVFKFEPVDPRTVGNINPLIIRECFWLITQKVEGLPQGDYEDVNNNYYRLDIVEDSSFVGEQFFTDKPKYNLGFATFEIQSIKHTRRIILARDLTPVLTAEAVVLIGHFKISDGANIFVQGGMWIALNMRCYVYIDAKWKIFGFEVGKGTTPDGTNYVASLIVLLTPGGPFVIPWIT